MKPRLLLDTHILIRWFVEPQRLSKEQARVLDTAEQRAQPVAISSITLWEVAQLGASAGARIASGVDQVLHSLENDPGVTILPLSVEIAREGVALRAILRDPADCIIAATARVHGLRLLTSDQRIIEANVVSTID